MGDYQRVWVVGAGAIGSTLAGFLHLAGRAKVILVGSSVHWQAIRKSGLQFDLPEGESHRLPLATASPDEVPKLGEEDLVLSIGKLPDFKATAAWLKPKLAQNTGFLSLHNGMDLDEYFSPLIGRPVDRGLVFFGAFSSNPGQVSYYLGGIRFRRSAVTESFVPLLAEMPVQCELSDDFRKVEWAKLALNCLANPLAGLLGVGNDKIVQPGLDITKEAILEEVRAVAAAEGATVDLTAIDFNERVRTDNVPSLRADILRGRPTEIDFLNGAVVSLGRKYGVPTPVNAVVVNLIKFVSELNSTQAA